ncbi:hypothetical protein Patl1_27042 [Pistacia atlantica]|uniref:Uncharacterized protein n=1 Tax=Pistacia atlantica TaxID=434234 RepID=A0ACC1B3E9_9ROSI|nr:hypothetical protein Patl1_27042 [Pistacia atlantica]
MVLFGPCLATKGKLKNKNRVSSQSACLDLAPLQIHVSFINNMETEDSSELPNFSLLNNTNASDSIEAAILRGRDALPSHFLFKIESFSLLEDSIDIYRTSQFEAGGFKWRLLIYPTGDSSKNAENHISIYLELMETSSLPAGWEVNVIFNFLIFNQLQDKYDSLQDGRVRRYHAMKTKWGITKFIDLKAFHNPLKGYLIDDTCAFGAEVFVVKSTFKGECLTMIKEPATCYHLWEITEFSTLLDEKYLSEPFGDYNWRISLYPNGHAEGKGNSISIFLSLYKESIPPSTKLFVKSILRVKDQTKENHVNII